MPGQIVSPVAVAPQQRKSLQVVTAAAAAAASSERLAGLALSSSLSSAAARYAGAANTADLPQFAIREHDYTVPAPPPPSPVSFRSDGHWLPPSVVSQAGVHRH